MVVQRVIVVRNAVVVGGLRALVRAQWVVGEAVRRGRATFDGTRGRGGCICAIWRPLGGVPGIAWRRRTDGDPGRAAAVRRACRRRSRAVRWQPALTGQSRRRHWCHKKKPAASAKGTRRKEESHRSSRPFVEASNPIIPHHQIEFCIWVGMTIPSLLSPPPSFQIWAGVGFNMTYGGMGTGLTGGAS